MITLRLKQTFSLYFPSVETEKKPKNPTTSYHLYQKHISSRYTEQHLGAPKHSFPHLLSRVSGNRRHIFKHVARSCSFCVFCAFQKMFRCEKKQNIFDYVEVSSPQPWHPAEWRWQQLPYKANRLLVKWVMWALGADERVSLWMWLGYDRWTRSLIFNIRQMSWVKCRCFIRFN